MSYFNCRNCKQTLDMNALYKGSYSPRTGNGKCKPCKSRYTSSRQIEKKMTINPQDYVCCNSCDRSMSKYRSTGKNNKRSIIATCKFCKSADIEEVV